MQNWKPQSIYMTAKAFDNFGNYFNELRFWTFYNPMHGSIASTKTWVFSLVFLSFSKRPDITKQPSYESPDLNLAERDNKYCVHLSSECPELKWMCHIWNKGKVKQDIRACSPCRRQGFSWTFSVKCIWLGVLRDIKSWFNVILIWCIFLKNDAFVWAKYG